MADKPIVTSSIDGYPNASRAGKANKPVEQRKPAREAVVKSDRVKVTKPSAWMKFKRKVIDEDAAGIKEYLLDNLIVPTVKKTAYDAVTNVASKLLYGDFNQTPAKSNIFGGGDRRGVYTYYNNISSSRASRISTGPGIAHSSDVRRHLEIDNFLFATAGDADIVLGELGDIMADDSRGIVEVARLYELCGRIAPVSSFDYGWNDLSNASVSKKVIDGEVWYYLNMPAPMDIRA